jgi:hypothetical protein
MIENYKYKYRSRGKIIFVPNEKCETPRDVDLAALKRPSTTFVHDLAGRLVCLKCKGAGKRPAATLLQLSPRRDHCTPED